MNLPGEGSEGVFLKFNSSWKALIPSQLQGRGGLSITVEGCRTPMYLKGISLKGPLNSGTPPWCQGCNAGHLLPPPCSPPQPSVKCWRWSRRPCTLKFWSYSTFRVINKCLRETWKPENELLISNCLILWRMSVIVYNLTRSLRNFTLLELCRERTKKCIISSIFLLNILLEEIETMMYLHWRSS